MPVYVGHLIAQGLVVYAETAKGIYQGFRYLRHFWNNCLLQGNGNKMKVIVMFLQDKDGLPLVLALVKIQQGNRMFKLRNERGVLMRGFQQFAKGAGVRHIANLVGLR